MKVAFLGLGNMGAPMARCLIEAGIATSVFDVNAVARAAFGDFPSTTAARAAANADVVITMLPDGDIVREALLGAEGALAGGIVPSVVVDMSSSDAQATRALGADLAARGIVLVDAPVSGGVSAAEKGALTLMIGCDGIAKLIAGFMWGSAAP